jgi:CcmD family protein
MDRSSMNFVIAAYAVTWVVLAAYAAYVHAGLRRTRAEYDRATRQSAGGTP